MNLRSTEQEQSTSENKARAALHLIHCQAPQVEENLLTVNKGEGNVQHNRHAGDYSGKHGELFHFFATEMQFECFEKTTKPYRAKKAGPTLIAQVLGRLFVNTQQIQFSLPNQQKGRQKQQGDPTNGSVKKSGLTATPSTRTFARKRTTQHARTSMSELVFMSLRAVRRVSEE